MTPCAHRITMNSPQLRHAGIALKKWRGASVQLVAYSPTWRVATLALEHEFHDGYLQVTLRDCSRIELPTRWSDCCLGVTDAEQTKQLKVEDYSVNALVVCSEIGVRPRNDKFWEHVS